MFTVYNIYVITSYKNNFGDMKPRILIIAHYLELGGAEISLIGLLNAIDYSRFDVELFLYDHRGELMKLIPHQVKILPMIPEYAQMENSIRDVLRNGFYRQVIARLRAKFRYFLWARQNHPMSPEAYYQYLDDEIMPTLPSLKNLGRYDLAVNFIALKNNIPQKVDAVRTATWIHTDLTAVSVNAELECEAWGAYDKIVSISSQTTASFVKIFPTLSNKIVEIENILSPSFVRHRATYINVRSEMPMETGGVRLLSVGRFCTAKNYDNVPDICRRIVEAGIKVKWYIIGFGGDEQLIRSKITEAGMEKHVIILGKKNNPYPYIKECDIYVQPSRYEGKSVTVREAQMLCKPVVVTNYATASSQVNNGVDGVIVPLENESCAHGIIKFIADDALRQSIENNLKKNDFGNGSEVEKFYDLLYD